MTVGLLTLGRGFFCPGVGSRGGDWGTPNQDRQVGKSGDSLEIYIYIFKKKGGGGLGDIRCLMD